MDTDAALVRASEHDGPVVRTTAEGVGLGDGAGLLMALAAARLASPGGRPPLARGQVIHP